MDGSLGGHTAALLEPYADEPSNSGLPRYETTKLNDMAKERVLAGFQLGFHAIGDKGIQMALDAFAEAEKAAREQKVKAANGGDDFRLRIEHAQVTTPAQIARFKELKVIASMQPSHVLTDMRWAQDRLGPKRAATSYAWAAFLNKGVTLGFRHGLSGRAGDAVSRALCRRHAQERGWQAGIFSRAATHNGSGDRGLHHGFGLCRVRGEGKRQTAAWDARGLRRARPRHDLLLRRKEFWPRKCCVPWWGARRCTRRSNFSNASAVSCV